MAGSDGRFDAGAFRDAIRFAMTMGLPQSTQERATFQWDTQRTFQRPDSGGSPYDWTATATTTITYPDVQIPVAVESPGGAQAGTMDDTPVGQFDIQRVIITILDQDFEEIVVGGVMANRVLLGETPYEIDFVAPPLGLFEVTVYQLHAKAVDES